jgi:hypothetical protein
VQVNEFIDDRRGRFDDHRGECCVPPFGLELGQVARGHLRALTGDLEQAIAMNGTLKLVGERNGAQGFEAVDMRQNVPCR